MQLLLSSWIISILSQQATNASRKGGVATCSLNLKQTLMLMSFGDATQKCTLRCIVYHPVFSSLQSHSLLYRVSWHLYTWAHFLARREIPTNKYISYHCSLKKKLTLEAVKLFFSLYSLYSSRSTDIYLSGEELHPVQPRFNQTVQICI